MSGLESALHEDALPNSGDGSNSAADFIFNDSLLHELPARAANALRRAGIRSNRQLLEAKEEDLSAFRNVGVKSLAAITAAQERARRERALFHGLSQSDGRPPQPGELEAGHSVAASERAAIQALWAELGRLWSVVLKEIHKGCLTTKLQVLIGPDDGDTLRLEDLLTTQPEDLPLEAAGTLFGELRVLCESLKVTTVDDELDSLLNSLSTRARTIVIRRRGLSSRWTQRELGGEFGVTGCRIGQLQRHAEWRLRRAVAQRRLKLPRFFTAIDFLTEWAEGGLAIGVEKLRERGLLRDPSCAEALLAVWEITGERGGIPGSLASSAQDGLTQRKRSKLTPSQSSKL